MNSQRLDLSSGHGDRRGNRWRTMGRRAKGSIQTDPLNQRDVSDSPRKKISDRLQRIFAESKEEQSQTAVISSESSQGSGKSINGLPKFEHPCAREPEIKPIKKKRPTKQRPTRRATRGEENDDGSMGSFHRHGKHEDHSASFSGFGGDIPLSISILAPQPSNHNQSSRGNAPTEDIHVDLTADFHESSMSIDLDDLYGGGDDDHQRKLDFPPTRATAPRPNRRPNRRHMPNHTPIKSASAHTKPVPRSLTTSNTRLTGSSYHSCGIQNGHLSLLSANSGESFACSTADDSVSNRMAAAEQEKEMIELAMQMSLHDSQSLRLDDSLTNNDSTGSLLHTSRHSTSTRRTTSSRYSTSTNKSTRSNRITAIKPKNSLFMPKEDRTECDIYTSLRVDRRAPVANVTTSALDASMNLSHALENETDPKKLEQLEMEMLHMALHRSKSEW